MSASAPARAPRPSRPQGARRPGRPPSGPGQPPSRPARRSAPRTARVLGPLLAGAATCGALLALDPLLAPGPWTTTAALAVLSLAVLLALLRAWWPNGRSLGAAWPSVIGAATSAIVLLVGYGRSGSGPTAPGTGAVGQVQALLAIALQQIDEGTPPLVAGREVTMLVTAAALVVLLLVDLAVALRVPLLGGVALLALWAPAVVLGETSSPWALVWAGLPWLALLTDAPSQVEHGRVPTSVTWAAGVLVVGLALAPVVATAPGWGTVPLPRFGSGSGQVTLSDDLDLRRDLQGRSGESILTYALTNPDGTASALSPAQLGPLRSFTLTDFDGRTWSRGDSGPRDQVTPDSLLAPVGSETVGGTPVQVSVTVGALADRYLPLTLAPRTLQIDGSWQFDPVRDLVTGPDPTRAETRYTMTAQVPTLTAANLSGQGSSGLDDPSTLALPGTGHREDVAVLAAKVVGGRTTGYDKAVALQTYLRTGGGFTYDEQVPPATSDDAVWDFLQDRRGYCVQFATTMVVMARSLGLPARLAVGFLPGSERDGTVSVTGRQAHAWTEIWFDRAGWVRFEPTPAIQTGAPPSWTVQQVTATPSASPKDELPTATARPSAGSSAPATLPGAAAPQRAATGWLVGGAVGVVLLALGGWWAVRRSGSGRRTGPEEAWAAARAALTRTGLGWTDAATPRVAISSVEQTGQLDKATVGALRSLATALEQFRYAASGEQATSEQLDDWVRQVRTGSDQARTRGRRRGAPDRRG